MTPELEHSFSLTIQVDKPIIVSRSPQSGKRQLIPILSGTVRGELNGHVLPGGVDSQIVEPDGTCRLSARYALHVEEGTVYIENNGIRRLPEEYKERLSATICAFLAIFRRKLSIFVPYRLLKWMRLRCAG